MRVDTVYPLRPAVRPRVIALHCSGADASQWGCLVDVLGDRYELLAPEHYGCQSSGPWTGEQAFTLAAEAARVIALIDDHDDKVHIVGHSYGGGVALHVALARPHRVASMALYEPSAFHLLRQMGGPGIQAYAEISTIAQGVGDAVLAGDYRGAAADFVDYWNGRGTWKAMRPAVQNALIRWTPKCPLDFRALMTEPTPVQAYRELNIPTLIMRGEHAPRPTRLIAEALQDLLAAAALEVIAGAGHMGPLTHAKDVSARITRHIVEAQAQPQQWRSQVPHATGGLQGSA
jgi:pimeloyl-ACP methyl ester carboxylesterase